MASRLTPLTLLLLLLAGVSGLSVRGIVLIANGCGRAQPELLPLSRQLVLGYVKMLAEYVLVSNPWFLLYFLGCEFRG